MTTLEVYFSSRFRCDPAAIPSDPGDLLRNTHFLVRPVHFPQRIANLADRGIRPHAIDDEGHGVGRADAAVAGNNWLLGSRLLERIEPPADFRVVAAGAEGLELAGLLLGHGFVNVKNLRLL